MAKVTIEGVRFETGSGELTTVEALTRADADSLVTRLEAAGHEASSAPDHDDRRLAWVYVTAANPDAYDSEHGVPLRRSLSDEVV